MHCHEQTFKEEVQLYREVGTQSRVNVDYLSIVMSIVVDMLDFGIPAEDIMIITFYAAQRRCYDKWFRQSDIQKIRTYSVNASQSSQSCFTIADLRHALKSDLHQR